MVLDTEKDRKLLLHIIANFPITGAYLNVGPAIKELDDLTCRVEQARIRESKSEIGGKNNEFS